MWPLSYLKTVLKQSRFVEQLMVVGEGEKNASSINSTKF